MERRGVQEVNPSLFFVAIIPNDEGLRRLRGFVVGVGTRFPSSERNGRKTAKRVDAIAESRLLPERKAVAAVEQKERVGGGELASEASAVLVIGRKSAVFDLDDGRAIRAGRVEIGERELFAAVSTSLQFNELSTHVKSEHYLTHRCGVIYLDSEPFIDVSGAMRHEVYNVKNYMLAAGALLDTVSAEVSGEVVRGFKGLAHRAQLVAERGGIKYYDSSVDSTPERTLATLRGLRGRNAVIIAGKGKRLSLFKLSEQLPRLSVGCVLMGEIGDELALLLSRKYGYKYVFARDMQNAVKFASELLDGEGNVILSPAGTSFDVYKNFEERGRAFCSAVQKTIEK
jgi:UDP-N-acetylmuramoylalanine-D-glutamate ligase